MKKQAPTESKPAVATTGRLAGFNPNDYANEYVTVQEVLEIKKGFDLFDHDGGGSIDPRGTFSNDCRTQSIHQLSWYWG